MEFVILDRMHFSSSPSLIWTDAFRYEHLHDSKTSTSLGLQLDRKTSQPRTFHTPYETSAARVRATPYSPSSYGLRLLSHSPEATRSLTIGRVVTECY
jgi:hypothetical protein